MYWQREVYRATATWTTGGTYRLELPDQGLLGAIMFHARNRQNTTGQTTYEAWRIMDYISELKIVGNGNRVIQALTGRVAHYKQFVDGGVSMLDVHMNYGTSTLRHHGLVTFGRKLFDLDYGLDLAAWDSVELQFTNDAGSGFTDNDFEVDIILYFLREASASQFKGYFKVEEWRKWTTVQDEWKYLDLPTEEKLRRLFIQVDAAVDSSTKVADTTLYNVAYEIELKLRSGAVSVYNGSLRDLWYDNAFLLGKEQMVGLQPYHANGQGVRTGLGQSFAFGGNRVEQVAGTQDTYGSQFFPGDDGHTLRRHVPTDPTQDSFIIAGIALENCAFFDFDLDGDPSKYLDLAEDGTVQLNVHTRDSASADDGTIRVVLDRLITGQGPRG